MGPGQVDQPQVVQQVGVPRRQRQRGERAVAPAEEEERLRVTDQVEVAHPAHDGRVLRTDGTPVPGLRAGGGTAVGLAGPHARGYSSGNGLLSAFGMGWIVGNDLAARGSGRSAISRETTRWS